MREASIHPKRAGRAGLRACFTAALLATAAALGGCAGNGSVNGAYAMARSDSPTIAFEQIDGPPPDVFDRMVGVLDSESKLRNLAIVSREAQPAYRVRSYLAAQVVDGHTMIDWVWDVYDRDQQRTLRLSGEEPAGNAGHDPWAAADDLVLRKIAQAGLSGLSGMINGAPQDAPAPQPAAPQSGPAIASAEPISSSPIDDSVGALSYTDH